jgi:hypothetical protein
MGKQYAYSCNSCFAFYYLPLHEALAQTKCPNCGEPSGSKKDCVYWVCEHCESHNDYDWEKCYNCGK